MLVLPGEQQHRVTNSGQPHNYLDVSRKGVNGSCYQINQGRRTRERSGGDQAIFRLFVYSFESEE